MVDPLSTAASIIALEQFTELAIRIIKDARAAAEDKRMLLNELQGLKSIISILNDRDKNAQSTDLWFRGFRELKRTSGRLTPNLEYIAPTTGDPKGELAELYMIVAHMKAKLDRSNSSHRLKSWVKTLAWHFYKEGFEAMLADVRKCREKITFILNEDNFALLLSLKEDGRETISVVKTTNLRIEDTHSLVENVLGQIDSINSRDRKKQEELRNEQEEVEREEIQKWLSPLDFIARQDEVFDDSFQTDVFLLAQDPYKDAFERWVKGQPWNLWLKADVGTGKTTLVSTVVNYLQQKFNPLDIPVLCLYLDYRESELQTLPRLLGSLFKQLIRPGDPNSVPAELRQLYEKVKKRKSKPRLDDIRKLLQAQIGTYRRVYIVVDAFDESPCRHELWDELRNLRPEKTSLMFTSRTIEGEVIGDMIDCDICQAEDLKIYFSCNQCNPKLDLCQNCIGKNPCKDPSHELVEPYSDVKIEIRIPDSVLKQYVESEMKKEAGYGSLHWENRRHTSRPGSTSFGRSLEKDPALWNKIPTAIVEKSRGRFLFAKLYMESLKKTKHTLAQIKDTLNNLPDKLNELYEKNLQRIWDNADDRDLAFEVLSRVVSAHRPLSLPELQHALVVQQGDDDFDEDACVDKESILSSTAGLIKIDGGQNPAVRLFQTTLLEYLKAPEIFKKWFPHAEAEMASACLTYLNFSAFSKPMNLREETEEFEAKIEKFPFIAYASQYWGDHVRVAGPESYIREEAVRLVKDRDRMAAYIQVAWYTDRGSARSWDVRKGVDGLHACAWFGLSSILSALDHMDQGVDVQEETYGQTPLMYACRAGHVEVVHQLLDCGASVEMVSVRGRTPLLEAIEQGHEEVVGVLLDRKGLDLNRVSEITKWTALMHATDLRHFGIVELLLKQPDIRVNQQDPHGCTALWLATRKGDFIMVRHLLQRPETDLNLADKMAGRTPLILAAERGYNEFVGLFLTHGADPMLKARGGGTAILRAIDYGHIAVVEYMLENANLDLGQCLDDDGRSLLHGASAGGHPEILHLLIAKNLDINASDKDGLTPLHAASRHGKFDVAKTLVELGADPISKDNYGRTPFTVAWQYGHTHIMDLLQGRIKDNVKRGDSTSIPNAEKLPLWSLAKLGLSDLVQEEIARRSERPPESEPGSNNTALHCAIDAGKIDILQMLLQDGKIPPDQVNRLLRTPLHLAALMGNIDAVVQLLDHQADLDMEDMWDGTPLSLAAQSGVPAVAIRLVEAGAKIDGLKVNVQNLFFAAVQFGSIEGAATLLSQGADLLSRNMNGLTALQLAKEMDDGEKMVRFLQSTKSMHYKPPDQATPAESEFDGSTLNSTPAMGTESEGEFGFFRPRFTEEEFEPAM